MWRICIISKGQFFFQDSSHHGNEIMYFAEGKRKFVQRGMQTHKKTTIHFRVHSCEKWCCPPTILKDTILFQNGCHHENEMIFFYCAEDY